MIIGVDLVQKSKDTSISQPVITIQLDYDRSRWSQAKCTHCVCRTSAPLVTFNESDIAIGMLLQPVLHESGSIICGCVIYIHSFKTGSVILLLVYRTQALNGGAAGISATAREEEILCPVRYDKGKPYCFEHSANSISDVSCKVKQQSKSSLHLTCCQNLS
jgi:hypothetical protein